MDLADGVEDGKEGGESEDDFLYDGGGKIKPFKGHKQGEKLEEQEEEKDNVQAKPKRRVRTKMTALDMQTKLEDKLSASIKKSRRKKAEVFAYVPKADYTVSNARGATFWISFKDFTKYFYIFTICFANKKFKQSFMQD